MRSGEIIEVTNHVLVTVKLACWDGECGPEVEMPVIEGCGGKVIEGNGTFGDKVMHEVASPTDATCVTEAGTTRNKERNLRNVDTKPSVEEIITGTRNVNGKISAKFCVTVRTGENYGDLGEPSSLASFSYEISYG